MSSAAIDAEPGFKMVEHRLLAENESEQVTFQANALAPLKGKKRHSIWSSAVAQIETDRMENGVKSRVSSDLLMILLITACQENRPALKRHESRLIGSNLTSTLVGKADVEADPKISTDPQGFVVQYGPNLSN